MKKLYLLTVLFLTVLCLQAQNPNNSHALKGTCLNPDDGTIDFIFDLNENCPEIDPNNLLPGTTEMGLHSGVNEWSSTVAWDDANSVTLMNNGNDSFLITINTMDYWGVAFGDIETIRLIPNDGALNPDDAWGEGNVLKDSTDGGGFGNDEPCSDMIIYMDQTPTCKDLAQNSSLSLFSDAGDSETCVDTDNGLIRVDLDYGLACPESDSAMVLAGTAALGFHSGANDWASAVAWDDAGAAQLTNDGNDNFSVVIDPAAYYGVALADLVNIKMVGNNGIANAAAPWDNTLRDPRNGGFGGNEPCSDLVLEIAEAPACNLVGTQNVVLQHSFKVTPNPFHNRTFLEFDNPNQSTFELVVTNLAGQTVRTLSGITGERVLIERESLPAGMYIANLIDENGNFATTKLVVK